MNERDAKKIKKAVALKYDRGLDQAPVVQAKGEGEIARRIIEAAKEYHIPVQEDPNLVALLAELDLNQMIPPELYRAVAEIFSFIYKIDESYSKKE
ncbi:MAG: EscU/YscU/HrcU family type III secretion system export apparatus switch protein [Sporolactobacillus sp.]